MSATRSRAAKLDHLLTRLRLATISVAILTLLAIGLIVAATLLSPRDRAFSVSASTEIVSIVVHDKLGLAARLPQIRLSTSPEQAWDRPAIYVRDGTRLTASRKRNGDMLIAFEGGADAIRLLAGDGHVIPVEENTILRVSLNRPSARDAGNQISDTLILPFSGELKIGEDIGPLTERTSLNGTVQIIERQPLSGQHVVVSEAKLDLGDQLEWLDRNGHAPANIAGFIYAGDESGLKVVAHAEADRVRVGRYGAAQYDIEPSIWEQLAHDPIVSGVAIILTLVGLIFSSVGVELGLLKK